MYLKELFLKASGSTKFKKNFISRIVNFGLDSKFTNSNINPEWNGIAVNARGNSTLSMTL